MSIPARLDIFLCKMIVKWNKRLGNTSFYRRKSNIPKVKWSFFEETLTYCGGQGYTLSSRIDGWTMVMFIPKTGRGEMRTWHSAQMETDAPALPGLVRKLVFDQLEPHRHDRSGAQACLAMSPRIGSAAEIGCS